MALAEGTGKVGELAPNCGMTTENSCPLCLRAMKAGLMERKPCLPTFSALLLVEVVRQKAVVARMTVLNS